jgi:hypothetical protein
MDPKPPSPPDKKLADNLKALENLPNAPEWMDLATQFLNTAKYLPPDLIIAWRGTLADLWAEEDGPTNTISGVRFEWHGAFGDFAVVATATTLSYCAPGMPCFEPEWPAELWTLLQDWIM